MDTIMYKMRWVYDINFTNTGRMDMYSCKKLYYRWNKLPGMLQDVYLIYYRHGYGKIGWKMT